MKERDTDENCPDLAFGKNNDSGSTYVGKSLALRWSLEVSRKTTLSAGWSVPDEINAHPVRVGQKASHLW